MRHLGSALTAGELHRFHRWAIILLVAASLAQGGQYVLAPRRPLVNDAYVVLRPIGQTGWQVLGWLLLLAAALTWWSRTRAAGQVLIAVLQVFLGAAQALHGYVPSTLIIPAGLSVVAVSIAGDHWHANRTKGGRECG